MTVSLRGKSGAALDAAVCGALGDRYGQGYISRVIFILNLLWLVCGGFVSGCLWLVGGAILACTIVGLPWTFAAWRIAGFVFWPFGRRVVDRELMTGLPDFGTGVLGLVLNLVWLLLAGWYIALSHLVMAALEAVTIIGLPFAYKDLQIAGLALMPVGKTVVDAR